MDHRLLTLNRENQEELEFCLKGWGCEELEFCLKGWGCIRLRQRLSRRLLSKVFPPLAEAILLDFRILEMREK